MRRLPEGEIGNRSGIVLVGLIAAIMICAILGIAIITLSTSSAYINTTFNSFNQARYLADSARRYQLSFPLTTTGTYTFTTADGDRFEIDVAAGCTTYRGIANPGTSFEALRQWSEGASCP